MTASNNRGLDWLQRVREVGRDVANLRIYCTRSRFKATHANTVGELYANFRMKNNPRKRRVVSVILRLFPLLSSRFSEGKIAFLRGVLRVWRAAVKSRWEIDGAPGETRTPTL